MLLVCFSMIHDNANKDKFEIIYYKYRCLLFNVANKIVNNSHDTEDVLQAAFLKIAMHLDEIIEIESKKTVSFLIVITRNVAFDFLRKSQKQNVISLEDCEVLPDDLDLMVEKIDYEAICAIIRSIPSPYQEVLYFHFVYDYSIKRTAEVLDRKYSTVKQQLVRGKKTLINLLSAGEEL